MEITEQLTDLDTVEVSFHGPQESCFEPTAAASTTTSTEFHPGDTSNPEAER